MSCWAASPAGSPGWNLAAAKQVTDDKTLDIDVWAPERVR